MKKLVLAACVCFCGVAFAQSEEAILSWATEGRGLVAEGKLSDLAYYKELHHRISLTSTILYPWKAENLRMVGQRVNIFEDVESGKISLERARRMVAEQQAEWDASNQAREKADSAAKWEAMQARRHAEQQAEAQQEAQRRALIIQQLQNRPAYQPYQHTPYQMPIQRQSNCTTMWNGAAWQTTCR